jgi:hypothetical protein
MAPCQDRSGGKAGREHHLARPGKYVGLAALERAESRSDEGEEDVGGGGLGYGISSWHVRLLAEAGMGYEEIGRMTPDQVYHRLCSRDVLKIRRGMRTAAAQPGILEADAEGFVRGRDKDGNPIKKRMRTGGKSLAARLNEEAEEREREERLARKRELRNGN